VVFVCNITLTVSYIGPTNVSEELITCIFRAEDGGNMFLWDVGTSLQIQTASQPRRPPSTSSPPWEHKIFFLLVFLI
jgi:hypothetical protein